MVDLTDSSLYLNRELSWLKFNTRVLAQSFKQDMPLLERLKFLAIYATNLDEFYMIRVAGLKQLFSAGVIEAGTDQHSISFVKLEPTLQTKRGDSKKATEPFVKS